VTRDHLAGTLKYANPDSDAPRVNLSARQLEEMKSSIATLAQRPFLMSVQNQSAAYPPIVDCSECLGRIWDYKNETTLLPNPGMAFPSGPIRGTKTRRLAFIGIIFVEYLIVEPGIGMICGPVHNSIRNVSVLLFFLGSNKEAIQHKTG